MVAKKDISKESISKAIAFAKELMENQHLMQQEALKDAQTSEFKTAIEILRKNRNLKNYTK